MKPPKNIYYIVVSGVGFILEGEVPQDLLDGTAEIYSASPRWTRAETTTVIGQAELDLD